MPKSCTRLGAADIGHALSRRSFLATVGATALATSLLGPAASWAHEAIGETLYFGGPIHTMNNQQPQVEAILVREGRIAALGTMSDVQAAASAEATRVDLGGNALLPGFFDPHSHVVLVGLQALSANLLPAPDGEGNDIVALQRLISAWIKDNPGVLERYKLAVGFGYDDSQLAEKRHPTRQELDAVTTDLPLVIFHQSSHFGVANSKALEFAGITAETANPPGGVFRREADGTPNGVMEENAFFMVVGKLLAGLDEAAYLAMIAAGTEFCASYGYTTVQEARATLPNAAMLAGAAERGVLQNDVLVFPDILEAKAAIKPTTGYDNHHRVGGAKLTIDGSPQGKTAWLTQPYFVPPQGEGPDYVGYPAVTPDQAHSAVDEAFANGWQIVVHANGDAAIDLLIESVRSATEKHGPGDRRTVLIHGQTCRMDQLDALKELGIIPSFFPMHTFYWGDWHRDSVLGPIRAETISPCASALAKGMIFTTHHDAPVANPDSMRVLSATVTRRTRSGDILGPNERVAVADALKAMTIWPAYQHFEEAEKGSLEVGKLADLVVLDQDPLAVDPEILSTLKVLETIKGGVSIYRKS